MYAFLDGPNDDNEAAVTVVGGTFPCYYVDCSARDDEQWTTAHADRVLRRFGYERSGDWPRSRREGASRMAQVRQFVGHVPGSTRRKYVLQELVMDGHLWVDVDMFHHIGDAIDARDRLAESGEELRVLERVETTVVDVKP